MMHVSSINGQTQSLLDESKQDIEGTTAQESAQIGKQTNSNLMSLSKEKTQETDDKQVSENVCVMCNRVYDTKDTTIEQKIVVDEAFCPICWRREITAYSDGDMDFSFLEGLVK